MKGSGGEKEGEDWIKHIPYNFFHFLKRYLYKSKDLNISLQIMINMRIVSDDEVESG